jgi:dipeptidyl aminopeptidase/acylaminoacyl peptidase
MIDDHDVREMLQRRADTVPATPIDAPTAVRRARRRLALNGVVATVAAAAIAVATFAGIDAIRSAPIPADDPLEELGIFAPVAGRIVYENGGNDRGYATGIWAVDPIGPSDSTEGLSVAEDVASTLERLDLEDAEPLGWSSDGTELLLMRSVGEGLLPEQYLSILHADGSETRLNEDPMGISDATISPDGMHVVFAGQYDLSGLYVIDVEGGPPVRLSIPQAEDGAGSPTFSPDGTQIAYLAGNRNAEVWVANSDGSDAHEILAEEATEFRGVSGPEWAPTGDRLAIGVGDHEGGGRPAIYTFSPDGSDFTQVIDGGISPYWSPDGSQIAFTIPCDEQPDGWCPEGSIRRSEFDPQPGDPPAGLAIADADGSNVREFGFAASGPWHPGTGRAREGEVVPDPMPDDDTKVRGWPDTTRNPPGVYSWDGSRCASQSCVMGFMHNGYGSGEVDIRIVKVSEGGIITEGATAATVAGHEGIHRRIDAQREEWIVDIEGTTIAIRLNVRPAASQADLDDVHAIIGSMRTEPRDNDLGFRLVFTLTTNDWDSG